MIRYIVFIFIFLWTDYLFSQRIVSLLPSYTEIIYELGAGDKIVGVTNFCNYPEDVKNKQKVGDYLNPDIEIIYKLKPDIIFMGNWSNKIVDRFKNKNIKIVVLNNERNVSDIYDTIKTIGKYLKMEKESLKLVEKMKKEIKSLQIKKSYRKVYIEIDRDNWTCGSQSFISDVISISGGVNIFNDINKDYFRTNWEEVIRRNPDVVLICGQEVDEFIKRPSVKQIAATRYGRIYAINQKERDIFSRPSPRIVEMIKKLGKIINE